MATSNVFPRTAPESWGEWPPKQERFDEAARRALAAARRIAARLAPDEMLEIEVWMNEPGDFASTFFAPEPGAIAIGAVLMPVLKRGWLIDWNPATGAGKLREQNARFDFEQERMRHRRTRIK